MEDDSASESRSMSVLDVGTDIQNPREARLRTGNILGETEPPNHTLVICLHRAVTLDFFLDTYAQLAHNSSLGVSPSGRLSR
jgi:hypothetical protein